MLASVLQGNNRAISFTGLFILTFKIFISAKVHELGLRCFLLNPKTKALCLQALKLLPFKRL